MRSADQATVFRVLLAVLAIYLILIKYNAALIVLLIAVAIALDAVDGFLAVSGESKGEVGFLTYLKYLAGNGKASVVVHRYKERSSKNSFGPRMDVAGDRAVEYMFWVLYTYLGILPLFVIFIVIIRHSFADAFMGSKGTSSKMRTWLGRVVYSSAIGRGGINVLKFITFSWLALVYISGYSLFIGYVLTALLVIYILARGIAEILENV